jgi:hypothetical protein
MAQLAGNYVPKSGWFWGVILRCHDGGFLGGLSRGAVISAKITPTCSPAGQVPVRLLDRSLFRLVFTNLLDRVFIGV